MVNILLLPVTLESLHCAVIVVIFNAWRQNIFQRLHSNDTKCSVKWTHEHCDNGRSVSAFIVANKSTGSGKTRHCCHH